jgi:hypothetical protein
MSIVSVISVLTEITERRIRQNCLQTGDIPQSKEIAEPGPNKKHHLRARANLRVP